MKVDSGYEIRVFHGDYSRSMSFSPVGGSLHGHWNADNIISTSDEREKTGIKELTFGLRRGGFECKTSGQQASGNPEAIGSIVKQLRPVMYHFKGSESKNVRFGFLAQELEASLPQVVRHTIRAGGHTRKGVVYQDLIAVLTAAMKEHQEHFENERRLWQAEKKELRQEIRRLDSAHSALTAELHTEIAARIRADETLGRRIGIM